MTAHNPVRELKGSTGMFLFLFFYLFNFNFIAIFLHAVFSTVYQSEDLLEKVSHLLLFSSERKCCSFPETNVVLCSLQLFNKYVNFASVVLLQAHTAYMWDVESRRSQVK